VNDRLTGPRTVPRSDAPPARLRGVALFLAALAGSVPAYLLAGRWLSPQGAGTVALVAYFVLLGIGGRLAAARAKRPRG
jgi:hypothetical protein